MAEDKMSFGDWLQLDESSRSPGSKSGLYPLGYNGIGLYPPQDVLTHAADAITYLTMDERIYKSKDGGNFNIKHLKPDPTFTHPKSPLPKHKPHKGSENSKNGIFSPKVKKTPGKSKTHQDHNMP